MSKVQDACKIINKMRRALNSTPAWWGDFFTPQELEDIAVFMSENDGSHNKEYWRELVRSFHDDA